MVLVKTQTFFVITITNQILHQEPEMQSILLGTLHEAAG